MWFLKFDEFKWFRYVLTSETYQTPQTSETPAERHGNTKPQTTNFQTINNKQQRTNNKQQTPNNLNHHQILTLKLSALYIGVPGLILNVL